MSNSYREDLNKKYPLHAFRITQEYKDKLKQLAAGGVKVGKTIAPALYRAIDDALVELRSKK